jgi:hypothetical protein
MADKHCRPFPGAKLPLKTYPAGPAAEIERGLELTKGAKIDKRLGYRPGNTEEFHKAWNIF